MTNMRNSKKWKAARRIQVDAMTMRMGGADSPS